MSRTLARQLHAELRQQDLESIDAVDRAEAPAGGKGAEPAEWGMWLVTLSASGGVLMSLISVAKDWLNRRGSGNRIKITINGDSVELDGASSAEQATLLAAFVRRHQTELPPEPG